MYFRTRKLQWDQNYSTFTDTHKGFYYLPQFSFPAGKTVLADPPACVGGNTTIKVPYEGNANYTFTVKGLDGNSHGKSIETNSPEMIKENGYYVFSRELPGGKYILDVEYKTSECPDCGCKFDTTFTVPEVPAFKLSNRSFPNGEVKDNSGQTVQIHKHGGTGKVSFDVSGSRTPDITIHAGNQTFSKTLTSSSVTDGTSYYKGNVSIDLGTGKYNIYASNTSCRSDTIKNVDLKEPAAITFTATPVSPDCNANGLKGGNTGNGQIDLSGISGGIGSYKYTEDGGTPVAINSNSASIAGLSAKTCTITVSDNYGNSTSRKVTVPAPSPVTATFSNPVSPSLWCLSDGKVTVNAAGGTSPYLYSKRNQSGEFQSDNPVTGYPAGDNTLYIRDGKGCIFSFTVNIPAADTLKLKSQTPTAPTCPGGGDGKCTLTMENRKGTLSVSETSPDISSDRISVNGNTITFTGLSTNNYVCKIRDTRNGFSCDQVVSFTVPRKDTIRITPSITPVSDKGSSTGKIEVKVSGGNGAPFNIELYDGVSGLKLMEQAAVGAACTFTGLAGNSASGGKRYKITVSDKSGCSKEVEAGIPEPQEALSLQANETRPVSCNGNSNAQVSLSATGGWGNYRYRRDSLTWTTSPEFSGLPAGDYRFYVRDEYSGSRAVDITVYEPSPLTITRDSLAHILCFNGTTGLIRYRISGGTYPYSLSTTKGAVNESVIEGDTFLTVSGLPAGNYAFTVKDSRNCTATAATETLTEPPLLSLSVPEVTHTRCELDNGSLSAKASGGVAPYTYRLATAGASFSRADVSNEKTVFDSLPGDTYRLTVTDSHDCTVQSEWIQVKSYTNPRIDACPVRDVACLGENNGRLEASAQSGTNPVAFFTLAGADSDFNVSSPGGIIENLYAGDYILHVHDTEGCRSSLPYPVTINEPESLAIEIDTILPAASKGAREGKILFRIRGGNTGSMGVRLRDTDGQTVDSISGVGALPLSFSVYAGEYFLEVTDRKGCRYTTEALQVAEPSEALRLVIREVKDALCKSQTGSIEVEGAGGWGGYRYKRASEDHFSGLNRFESLYPGNYLVTVTDRMGAVYSETITVYEPQDSLKAGITALLPPSCGNNGSLSILLSGGTPPYRLYNENDTLDFPHPQTVDWTGIASGDFLLHLTDANGCRFEMEASLPATSLLRIENLELTCPSMPGASDGAIRALVAGGIPPCSFRWQQTETGTLYSGSPDWNNLPSGYYRLDVDDAGGCSVQAQCYLASPGDSRFTLVETRDETAFGAANGYAILYSPLPQTAYRTVSPQQAETHYLPGDSTRDFFVRNDTVYLQNLEGGSWFVSGGDAGGSQAIIEFEIRPYPEFAFSQIAAAPVSRPGGSDGNIRTATRGGGGGLHFTWTDAVGQTFPSVDSESGSRISGLPAGLYTVEAEDRYGNRISTNVRVDEPEQALQISLIEQQNQSCKTYEDAYAVLEANGGWGDYQFSHRDTEGRETGFSNAFSYAGLSTGEHCFRLIDKAGILDSIKINILEPEYLRTSPAFIDSVKCKDASDGRIVFDVTGGTAPYAFMEQGLDLWNPGNEARSLKSGEHTFIFTDSHFCEGQDTLTVYVPEPDSLLFKDISITHTVCNEDNGQIAVALQGGTRPYSYRWLDFDRQDAGNDSIISGLKQNGLYRLGVTDYHGCTQQLEQLIRPSTLPRVEGVETGAVLCYGDTTGTARVTSLTPAEPFAPYTLTWSNGDEGTFSSRFPEGQHYVAIADTNRCRTAFYFDVTQPDSLSLFFSEIREPHCFGYSDGHILTETRGGWGDYSYLWSNGSVTPDATDLTKGDYSVIVTDANGCARNRQTRLEEPAYQTLDLGEDILMCPGNTQVLDGQDYRSYRWFTEKDGDISFERYLSADRENHYFLEARDERGCSVWGGVTVSIGNSALIADLLLASEAAAGDTLVIFELSNMELDSLRWEYDSAAFERVEAGETDELYGLPYVLQLKCLKTGIYNIELLAYSGGCSSPASKQVEIVEAGERDDDSWNRLEPLITSLKQYPNPNGGLFTVEIELREVAAVRLVLFEVASGACVDQRSMDGAAAYRIEYDLPHLNTGVYALLLTAGKERRQMKIIIER